MSDNWLKFVPVDPTWQPTPEAADRTAALLAAMAPGSDEIKISFNDKVELVHPYANWSGVKCPSCGADADGWWSDAVERAGELDFAELEVTTPCCSATVSLNDLSYVWPAAFGRFVLEAMNPNIGDTSIEQDRSLSECIGMELRKVWVHL
jgi:hypothetical protein